MANKKSKPVLYRRKRERRTNYKKRLSLLKSGKPRLVYRSSNTKIVAQVTRFNVNGDLVVLGVDSKSLNSNGWKFSKKNIPASYLTGLLLAKVAKEKGFNEEVVFDTGLVSPKIKGRIYAFLKGTLDGGLKVLAGSDRIFPEQDKLSGKDIESYANNLKENDKKLFETKFSSNLKNKADPTQITASFEKVKKELTA